MSPGPIPPATPKQAYGNVTMATMASLYDALDVISPNKPIKTDYPITMEALQQVKIQFVFVCCFYISEQISILHVVRSQSKLIKKTERRKKSALL